MSRLKGQVTRKSPRIANENKAQTSSTRKTAPQKPAGLARALPTKTSARLKARAGLVETKSPLPTDMGRTKNARKVISTRPLLKRRVLDLPATKKRLNIRKIDHPLSKDFDEATSSYSEELMEGARNALSEQRDALLARLNGNADAADEALQAEAMLADAIEAAIADAVPISEAIINVKSKTGGGKETSTLEQRVERFKKIVSREEANIAKLTNEYDAVLHELAAFAKNNLDTKEKQSTDGNGVRHDADVENLAKQLEKDIEELGKEELHELEEERKADKMKRKRLLEALQGL